MNTLETSFRDYLISQGYKQTTPSGHPSTVYDYCKRIAFVCNIEGLTWQGVKTNIKTLVMDYDYDGSKSILGAKSHNSVISALKRFHARIHFYFQKQSHRVSNSMKLRGRQSHEKVE